ncbi:MAG: endonuclease/exonuclease/phosphatase family protein [Desulfobulbaceae bacterium]|nr:endonuclease/exonuclease/phosphatase family protein [Desulfobulbaceae bacterium]
MQIKVLSYNIHRAIGVDRRFRPERIVSVLEHHRADIVFLQEVDVGVPRSRELDLAAVMAKTLNYPYYALGLNVKVKQGHYGNATLSRFPISAHRNIDLTVDRRKKRGCLYTAIALPTADGGSRELAAFNLHLGLSTQERIRQVGMLVRSAPYAAMSPELPCLVGGDFNDWRTMLAPIFIDILGFSCATNRKTGHQEPLQTYPSFSPTGGLDKIFCRGGIEVVTSRRCKLRTSMVASDHLPVIAELQLP